MSAYTAPLDDIRFVINEIAGLDTISALPGYEDASADLVDAVLEEAARFGGEVLAPLNRIGDTTGCSLENGVVRSPDGFRQAYASFVESGWNGIPFDPEYGGQGLPWLVATAVSEIWDAANMAFSLCPLLTQGTVELLSAHGTDDQKSTYLPKLISGEWNGTMNLTEPQAGSDLARLRAKADREGDHYRIKGQKIFITYGETDFTDNVIHMVLARTPDAPPGVKGISLFIVPKFLVNEDGSLGERNDLRCVSLEHKLGIHASPTAVMSFGDDDGAVGYLVGEENRGLQYMFTMMNNARLAVGLEGVAVAERAYQQARDFAQERVQGTTPTSGGEAVTIIHHPDVRRMLLSMRAQTEATRALAYFVAAGIDKAKRHPDADERRRNQALVDLLIPVVKGWSSDVGIDVANTGVQVHGGMGFIEETGAAQHLRDVRITAIYEGTNGIQAADLVGRKVGRDGGTAAKALIGEMRLGLASLSADAEMEVIGRRLGAGIDALETATDWLVETIADDADAVAAGAAHYMRLVGIVAGGWLMAKAAATANVKLAAGEGDPRYLKGKVVTTRFFADHILVQSDGLADAFSAGASSVAAAGEDLF